jgi:hypothetical protein
MSNDKHDTPHFYVPTKPYRGCGKCGFGPGTYAHNTENVRRHQATLKLAIEDAEHRIETGTRDLHYIKGQQLRIKNWQRELEFTGGPNDSTK